MFTLVMAVQQSLTHAQRVCRLYRRILKNQLDWIIYRDVWRVHAVELRAKFDANKNVDMETAQILLEDSEKELEKNIHPDPYIGKSSKGYDRLFCIPKVD